MVKDGLRVHPPSKLSKIKALHPKNIEAKHTPHVQLGVTQVCAVFQKPTKRVEYPTINKYGVLIKKLSNYYTPKTYKNKKNVKK